jgi:hypothetical protein
LPASGQGTGCPAGDCFFAGAEGTFATLGGTIQEYFGPEYTTTIVLNNSAKEAVYTACTKWETAKNTPVFLYVANSAGGVEEYDLNYNPVTLPPGTFVDPSLVSQPALRPTASYRISLHIPNDPFQLVRPPHPVIVGLVLPERQARAPEDGIRLARRRILDGWGDPR